MTNYSPQAHVLVVTYNLKGVASSYVQFYETLKARGPWWHYLPSTWLIHTADTPEQAFNALHAYLQTGDHLFIGTLQDGYSGWLPKAAWEWLKSKGLNSSPK